MGGGGGWGVLTHIFFFIVGWCGLKKNNIYGWWGPGKIQIDR